MRFQQYFYLLQFSFPKEAKMKSDFKNKKNTYPNRTTHKTDCVRYQELWQEVQLDCEQIA